MQAQVAVVVSSGLGVLCALGRGEGAYLVGEVTPHTAILWARLYLHGPAAAEDIISYEEALRCSTSAWSPSAFA